MLDPAGFTELKYNTGENQLPYQIGLSVNLPINAGGSLAALNTDSLRGMTYLSIDRQTYSRIVE